MDLFKYNPTSTDWTTLTNASPINNLTNIMWIERYRNPGEFKITGRLSSGLIQSLPLGSLISHLNTLEVMMVENQEVTQDKDSDAIVTISGRPWYAWLENRIVGSNQVRASTNITEYALAADYTWKQAEKLINDHIYNTQVYDALGNVLGYTAITGTGAAIARSFKRMDLLTATLELLELDDLGIQTLRKSRFSSDTWSLFHIYKGVNRAANVVFSWDRGDIVGADYLWSNKSTKTSAIVVGSKYNVIQDDKVDFSNGALFYNRKQTVVDGNDIDSSYVYDAGTINALIAKMKVRANQAVANNNQVSMTRLDVAPQTRYIYRKDYNLGDIVTVEGNFNVRAAMRVVEHAEIMDENGSSGHPTLAIPLA